MIEVAVGVLGALTVISSIGCAYIIAAGLAELRADDYSPITPRVNSQTYGS